MRRNQSFTLIELLVVISIIGMLASIILVSLQGARAKARLASAIAFGANMYHGLGTNAVLRLAFQEGSGGTTADTSMLGNSNNGTLGTGVTWSTDSYSSGNSPYSLSFNGSGGVQVARPLGLAASNFTVSMWVKTTSNSGQLYVFGNDGGGTGYRFGLGNGQIAFLIGNQSPYGFTESTCGPTGISDGTWHQIVGVFDRKNSLFTCYLDGTKGGSVATISYNPNMLDNAPNIGKPPCCQPFTGSLDDVAVYATNLDGVAVRERYEGEKARFLAMRGVR